MVAQQNPNGLGSVLMMAVLLGGVAVIGYRLLQEDKERKPTPLGTPKAMAEGMAMYGDCATFVTMDKEAWKAFATGFSPSVPVEPENAETILAEMFSSAFPSCQWPPGKAITIDGMTWGQQVEAYRESLSRTGIGGITS